jgi:hypothetical protein
MLYGAACITLCIGVSLVALVLMVLGYLVARWV